MIQLGKSVEEVAKAFNCSAVQVRRACDEFDVKYLRKIEYAYIYKTIALLLNTDKNLTRISELVGTTRQRVNRIYKKALKNGILFPNR